LQASARFVHAVFEAGTWFSKEKPLRKPLRIVVADVEPERRAGLERTLTTLGHQVVAAAGTGTELVELCRATQPDLVITQLALPALDGIDAASAIVVERPVPIILIGACHDDACLERVVAAPVMTYLVSPIKEHDLGPAIAVARNSFRLFDALHQEAAALRYTLDSRKVIERAKGVLMKCADMDEETALHYVQSLATARRCHAAEAARWILSVEGKTATAKKR
jgi:response regulator NasT